MSTEKTTVSTDTVIQENNRPALIENRQNYLSGAYPFQNHQYQNHER